MSFLSDGRKIRVGRCLLLVFLAVICGFVLRAIITSFAETPRYSKNIIPEYWLTNFTFDVTDPAAYWGEYSILIKVDHPRYDAIMYNPNADNIRGYVVLGMSEGRIACFYIEARQLYINGTVFPFPWGAREFALIAAALTQNEIDDLRDLAKLVWDEEVLRRMRDRAYSEHRICPTDLLQDFDRTTDGIAKMKRKITKKRSGGTSPKGTVQSPGIQTSGSATLKGREPQKAP